MSAVLEFPQRHAITAEEFLRMGEAGVFGPEARLELIEGGIVEKAPIGSQDASCVAILHRHFVRTGGDSVLVWGQSPIWLDEHSVPQPDLALLRRRADHYSRSHPRPADVLLVIKVSDATLAWDLGTKVPLYARTGIPEAWVVDLAGREVRVFRDPAPSGYRTSFAAGPGATVSLQSLAAVRIAVAELFPG